MEGETPEFKRYYKKATEHIPAWFIATIIWLITNSKMREEFFSLQQESGSGRGFSDIGGGALLIVVEMVVIGTLVAMFGSFFSAWLTIKIEDAGKSKAKSILIFIVLGLCLYGLAFLYLLGVI